MANANPDEVDHQVLQFRMTQAERRKVSRLIHRRDALHEQHNSEELSWDDYRLASNPINQELADIASEVGKRTLRELPLTLRTDWSDHVKHNPVVVLEIVLSSDWKGGYSWCGEGYELRKDGSVGIKHGRIRLDNHLVWRRHLDGAWKPLIGKA